VFELLTKVAAGQDWTTAILETIPMRKGAKAKITDKKEPNHCLEQQDEKQKQEAESDKPTLTAVESEIESHSLDS